MEELRVYPKINHKVATLAPALQHRPGVLPGVQVKHQENWGLAYTNFETLCLCG
jgi:hypothetical protein